jgi:hypothetical protein
MAMTAPAIAGDGPFGALDFSRLSKPQEQFFWKRLKSLAFEEGAITYCGQPDGFAARAVSVTLGAMAFDRQGRIAFDMPALIASSKDDLKYVSDEVTEMCRKCKTTIWAIFCR